MSDRIRRAALITLAAQCLLATAAAPLLAQATRPAGERRAGGWRERLSKLPEGVRALRDLEYARPDGKPLHLDLFLPEKSGKPLPLVVWVHGGGWKNGNKNGCPAIPFTALGMAAASIDYRLTGEAQFPAQIHDCKAAIRWLRAHAKEYNIDPDRIGVWGGSAGGHLVALLGTTGGMREFEGPDGPRNASSRVQAVCDYFGPADLVGFASENKRPRRPDAPEAMLLGGTIEEKKDLARAASPVTHATKDDPPFLIMHGDQDPLVPLRQSELLNEALKKAGVDVSFEVIKGAGHGTGFGFPEQRRVFEFFKKHLQDGDRRPGTQKAPDAQRP